MIKLPITGTVILVVVAASLGLLATVGCESERAQSSLHPAGPASGAIATLWWIMLVIFGLYALAVFVLTVIAIFRRSAEPQAQHSDRNEGKRFIMIGGAILPTIILVPLLAYTVHTTSVLRMKEAGLKIRIVGHRWWWEVEYPDYAIVTANEIRIPVGEPVELQLESADVIHSFWVPRLHGKMDMIPGRESTFWLQANRAGRYRGQCAEYCGLQHAHMGFIVEAVPPTDFVRWLEMAKTVPEQIENKVGPQSIGFRLFKKHGCSVCHRIEGTSAQGWSGPDLTDLALRSTLAAATIENTPDNLFRWLVSPQSIKPGANMPATEASEEEIKTIVDFLLNTSHVPDSSTSNLPIERAPIERAPIERAPIERAPSEQFPIQRGEDRG